MVVFVVEYVVLIAICCWWLLRLCCVLKVGCSGFGFG